MDLADLFEKSDTIVNYKERASSKRTRKSKCKVTNIEALSPEAYKHYSKESTGVAQFVTVRMSKSGTFIYISHTKFD